MIVKNESSCIEKCLESVKDADEIVIIDTGSIDNTVELCKKYTDKVFVGPEYLWRDDFSFSRNQSLERCTGDWILIIDADEHLAPGEIQKIKEVIKTTDKDAFMTSSYDSGTENFSHYSIRLFKKLPERKWCAPIHNYLNFTTEDKLEVKHYVGYSEAHKLDPDRAFRILGKEVIKNPKSLREKFYLAREYFYRKDYNTAIKYYEWYLEDAYFWAEINDTYMMLAYCYNNIGNIDKAKEYCLKSIALNTNNKEAILFMAELSGPGNKKRWEEFAKTATNEGLLFVRKN